MERRSCISQREPGGAGSAAADPSKQASAGTVGGRIGKQGLCSLLGTLSACWWLPGQEVQCPVLRMASEGGW